MKTDRAKSCHFASDFGAVLPAFSGGTCPGARDERPVVLVFDRIENGKNNFDSESRRVLHRQADNFVPLKRGDFIICRERTLDNTDERGSVHHTNSFQMRRRYVDRARHRSAQDSKER